MSSIHFLIANCHNKIGHRKTSTQLDNELFIKTIRNENILIHIVWLQQNKAISLSLSLVCTPYSLSMCVVAG